MPPETFPSEIPNERRNERPPPADSVAPGSRRRDPRLRDPRIHRSFRPLLPGNGRQGPNNPAESGHGYTLPHAKDRCIGNMGQFVPRDMRVNSGGGDVAPNSSGRLRLQNDPRLQNEKDLKRHSPEEPSSEPGSIDWRPLNWTRSGSFTLRGQNTESPPVSANPLGSPGGMPAVSADEAGSRKKTRLGWGEGLVKYEKIKGEGPDNESCKVSGLFDPASASTPSFVDCSSSPEDGEITEALEDPATVESCSERSTPAIKLPIPKDEAVRAIVEIESEIDSLEKVMKMLSSMVENHREMPCDDKGSDSIETVVVENLEESPLNGSDNGIIEDQSSLEDSEHTLSDRISALNKDIATGAKAVLENLLSSNNSRTSNVSWRRDVVRIKKKLAFKKKLTFKKCRTFEERVKALKYRALQNQWKESLKLSLLKKKNCSKSQKGLEISSGGPRGSDRKQRHSLRSGSSNAAGNLSLTPTTEVMIRPYRNFLKMPAMITDKERNATQLISNNSLVEDPCAAEKERATINPWTKEERDIFMDKFATFGKNFNKISSFLQHKTTADCVQFYYKNHKSDWFVKPKKKPDSSKQGICGSSPKSTGSTDDGSDDSCSDDSRGEADSADWTEEEKYIFLEAFATYGKDFAMILQHVGTKSGKQCNVFFSKVKNCFGLENGVDAEHSTVANEQGLSESNGAIETLELSLDTWINSDDQEDTGGNRSGDLNLNDNDRDNAQNVGGGDADVEFWGNSEQVRSINIDLNPPLRSLDINTCSHSWSSLDSEKTKGDDDVILFGQNLKSQPNRSCKMCMEK